MAIMQLRPLSDNAEFVNAFSRAAADIGNHLYYVADAYTHAPITPYAPIQGVMGIAADIARSIPGMTAMRADDIAPDRRASFAEFLDNSARYAMDASERYADRYMAYRAANHAVGMQNTLARANRFAEESDRDSDRAHCVRRAIPAHA